MQDCIFCKIVSGMEPASIVFSDDKVLAFMDVSQVNLGHVLVIPKTHADNLAQLDPETGAHLFKVTMRLVTAVRRSNVRCEGVNLFVSDGAVAFQSVFHFHMHIIPRYKNDGFGLVFGPNNRLYPDREVLDTIAADIVRALKANQV